MSEFAGLLGDRFPGRRGPVHNHHTDPDIARQLGLPGTVAQALHYCGYISEMLFDRWGHDWLTRGDIEMAFLKPVYAGDEVQIAVESVDGDGTGPVIVNCRNQRGELVATGSARLDGDA
jgi:3-hydroxybutyryl-CoA dehydratase